MKRFYLLVAITTIFIASFNCWASQNYISNGDFESHKNGEPIGWNLKVAEPGAVRVDSKEFASGKLSLKINHKDINSSSWALQEVIVNPNSTYQLTGRMRIESIKKAEVSKGARIFIGDINGTALATTSEIISGAWQEVKLEFSTASNNQISIVTQLHKASGAVWFDELVLSLKYQAPSIPENLLINSSFEDLDRDSKLIRWSISGREGSVMRNEEYKVDGLYSVQIRNLDEAEYNSVAQHNVQIRPNTNYILTGWIKGENIIQKGFGARIYTNIKSSSSYKGTFDWQEIRVEFNSGDKTSMSIVPYLHQSSGIVWFDNIKLIEKSFPVVQELPVQENLLVNASIEEWDKDSKPVRWSISGREGSVTRNGVNKVDGLYSVQISNLDETEYNSIAQHGVQIKPNTDYILTGWIKGENIIQKGYGARIYTTIKSSSAYSGTFDWQEIRVEFNSGDKTSMSIVPYLHQSSGTVWFDNIKLIEKSVPVVQELPVQENLLVNASIEEWDKDSQPVRWSVKGREGSVTRSEEYKVDELYSVQISNLDVEEYNYIAQNRVQIKPNTNYVLTGWIKGENIIQKGFGARIYTTIKSSSSFSGTFDWQEIRVEFNSGDKTTIDIVPYLHQSSGTVWFDNIKLVKKNEALSAGSDEEKPGKPFSLSGRGNSLVYYSPDTGLNTDNYLRLSTSLSISDSISARFYIYTLYESPGVGFEKQPIRQFKPWLDYLTLTLKGPLLPSSKPISLVFGKGFLNLSPYVAHLNYDYSAIKGQGIILNELRWGKFDLSGFLIFERQNLYRDIGNGIRIRGSEGPWKGEMVIVKHLSGDPIANQEGKIISLDKYSVLENDLLIQVERQFNKGRKLNFLRVEQRKYGDTNSLVTAQKVDITLPISSSKFVLSYRDFKPGFAPRYRDTTPRYRESDDTILGWNPVDRYRNQLGGSIDISTSLLGMPVRLELEHYKIQPELTDLRTNLSVNLRGKNNISILGSFDELTQPLRYFDVMVQRQIVRGNWGNLSGHIRSTYDRTGMNNGLKVEGSLSEYMLETVFSRSFLSGLKLSMGTLKAQENYWLTKGEWLLLGNVQFTFSHLSPRVTNLQNSWIDEYNRLHYRTNYVSLKSIINF